jgi:hypothetical protein
MLDKFLTGKNVKVNDEIAGRFWEPCSGIQKKSILAFHSFDN